MPIDGLEVKKGFIDAIKKMYTPKQETIAQEQFHDFALLSGPTFLVDGGRSMRTWL